MSNCPTCKNFVSECCYGCYCNVLKRPIFFDENASQWVFIAYGWKKLEGSTVIAIKNCKPYTIENRQYVKELVPIENCEQWRSVCVEAYTSQNLAV
jgi:hypothetical protein